jgi:hypothetical protein
MPAELPPGEAPGSVEFDCPRCIDERLIKALGNLLVCPSCDVVFVESKFVNHWLPNQIQVLPESA